ELADPPAHQGVTLRVACPAPADSPPAAALRTVGRAWAGRQQARLEFVAYDRARGPDSVKADVWVVRPADRPRHASARKLTEVPGSLTAPRGPYEWGGLLPSYRILLRWDGHAYGLPVLGEGLLCFARDRPDAGVPATWGEFEALAGSIHKATGKPSLPPL